jgi:PAS domain S-box-containing protein
VADRDAVGWYRLFNQAFAQSRNPMALVDDQRVYVDVNGALVQLLGHRRDTLIRRHVYDHVADGPLLSRSEWAAALRGGEFNGAAELLCADGSTAAVQWAASTEVVTGRRLVLFVALSTSRWGSRSRPPAAASPPPGGAALSRREREIVSHVAHGSSGPEIAAELQISHETVRTHVRNAMVKLGARSRAHLVAKALGEGHALG